MKFITISKKKGIIAVVVVLAAVLGYYSYRYYETEIKFEPVELVQQAIDNTIKAKSYSFQTSAKMLVNGRGESISTVSGEKSGPSDYHFKGNILKSDVEVYQVGNTTYMKDQQTGKWMTIEDNDIAKQEVLMIEINPLANFNFKDIAEMKFLRKENLGQVKCRVFEIKPNLDNQLLEMFWQRFKYQIWIDNKDKFIRKAVVSAASKTQAKAELNVIVEFNDFGQSIKFNPPVKP